MGIDLTQHEVSVVNVGSTAYLHFARIFMRKVAPEMEVKCAIVTDLDVRPDTANKAQVEKINGILLTENWKAFAYQYYTLPCKGMDIGMVLV